MRRLAGLLCWIGLLLAPAAMAQDWHYRVRPGDTLWDLGRRYLRPDVNWMLLGQHNQVADPYRLAPGARLRFPIAWLRVQPAPARLVALRGQISVQTADRATLSAQEGMPLPIGSALQTGADASATVQFADGSRMQVRENSLIRFDQLIRYGATGMVDTRVRLEKGRTSNDVIPANGPASRYIIQTPSSTSSVRGTRFRVGAGDGHQLAATEVLQGAVRVAGGGGQRLLQPGDAARVGAGAAPLPEPLLPAPMLDLAHSRLQRPPYLLAWAPLAGASRYRLEAVDAQQREVLRFAQETEGTALALDALPAGDLRLLLRGVTATGVEGQDAEQPLLVSATPLPPLTVQPLQQQRLRIARPRFAWTRNPEAISSVLQLARDAQFRDLLLEQETDATHLRAPQPLPPGTYFWRLASRDAQGRQGPFGQALTLHLSDTPVDPGLAPAQAERGTLTLRWQPDPDARHYRVQLARDPAFRRGLLERTVTQPQVALPRPRRGTWYVRIQTLDAEGEAAPFSTPQTLDLPCRYCKLGTAGGVLLLWLAL
ncbi:hypothetical protein FHR56_001892 [Xanthomonas sacchari]|uniref:FecR family protein n=1 Tax=unclassified Xanthomonas TaxID=2643310 RepID=UPI001368694F|nr:MULTISPECIES: FecR domain-containing protein [unclassified Xanthomonas]MBB6366779.1 hypothetical protein [Xanthomonas sp. F10]MXV34344.1 LysM peptidoglycan-binding domain-containing protein [Xanthomonas sp. LMG 8989]